MQNAFRTLLAAILFAGARAGCGGGGAEARTELTTVSQGQELLDLKKAYDSGAITKDEYERVRSKILNK
jgi:uncharacterized membrane protein